MAYANVDLVFRNPFSWPITVTMRREGSLLVAQVSGRRPAWKRVEVRSVVLDTFVPPPAPVQPGSGFRRSRWQLEGRNGVRVVIEREMVPAGTGKSGPVLQRLSDNTYLPIAGAVWR